MTTHEHAHPGSHNKQYFMTWCWLLFMTLLALGLGYVGAIQGPIKTILLVGITLAKIFLIGSIFMHLKTERVNLIMLTFTPLVLSIILFAFTFGETRKDPTHDLQNVKPGYVVPSHKKGQTEAGAEAPEAPKPEEQK
jgi:caa(3)-type oxidase subunit IV